MRKSLLVAALSVALLWSCSTPTNIAYFQDMSDQQVLASQNVTPIRLKPMDQVSIIVNTREAVITSMFNKPYYTNRIGETQSLTSSAGSNSTLSANNISGYTLDAEGNIDFPVVGLVQAAGKTRDELASHIKSELMNRNLVNDPVVTVEFINLQFSVMGEVRSPGTYRITRDRITILDALSMAGDLSIDGKRDNVLVLRPDTSGNITAYNVDMRSFDNVKRSPAYFIHQNDYIYVEPNAKRANQSTVNANTVQSVSFWISVASFLASMATTVSVLMMRWGN